MLAHCQQFEQRIIRAMPSSPTKRNVGDLDKSSHRKRRYEILLRSLFNKNAL